MPSEVYDWTLVQGDRVELIRYDVDAARLQVNGELSMLTPRAAQLFRVMLRHPDTPLTSDDFHEDGIPAKGGQTIRAGMKDLKKDPLTGRHVLQVGENAQAVYGFITNPDDVSLFKARLEDIHNELYGGHEGREAQRSHRRLAKVASLAAGVGAAAAGYVVFRKVHRKS